MHGNKAAVAVWMVMLGLILAAAWGWRSVSAAGGWGIGAGEAFVFGSGGNFTSDGSKIIASIDLKTPTIWLDSHRMTVGASLTLDTCDINMEGRVLYVGGPGHSSGHLCLCTKNATLYQWCNAGVGPSCIGGTATLCP